MANKPEEHTFNVQGSLKAIGGSSDDNWNRTLANQVAQTAWTKHAVDAEDRGNLFKAGLAVMVGGKPKDELEGILLAQLVAAHNAAMDCYRRVMLHEQTAEGRAMNLAHAGKMSRTCAQLIDGLNKHRGKGQQVVRVEHVHIEAGAQAVIGNVTPGAVTQKGSQPHEQLEYSADASLEALPSQDPARDALPVSCNEERPMPHTRRAISGRSKG